MNTEIFKQLSIPQKLDIVLEHAKGVMEENERLSEELRIHVQENKSIAVNNSLIRKENERLEKKNKILVKFERKNHSIKLENLRYKQALEEIKISIANDKGFTKDYVLFAILDEVQKALKGEEHGS